MGGSYYFGQNQTFISCKIKPHFHFRYNMKTPKYILHYIMHTRSRKPTLFFIFGGAGGGGSPNWKPTKHFRQKWNPNKPLPPTHPHSILTGCCLINVCTYKGKNFSSAVYPYHQPDQFFMLLWGCLTNMLTKDQGQSHLSYISASWRG